MKVNPWEIEAEKKKEFIECAGNIMPESIVNWLFRIGYFIAPAGKTHHGACYGGLFDHSYQFAQELSNMTIKLGLKWQRPESPVVIGLLHDVCKVNEYNMIVDESEEKGYRIEWNKKQILTGHGVASVMMIQQYAMKSGDFILTEEEMMCIRYHMGAYTDKSEWEFYGRAIEKYPNVLYAHTADMIASKIKGK